MNTGPRRTGGCQCGSLRYRLNGEPRMLYACHCRDCQKQSSSAFGMSLIVAREDLEFTAGIERIKTWDTRGDDGLLKRCAFCPDCGTRIYHAGEPGEETVSVKAGSLDDTGWLRPLAQIWLKSAQPWIEVDASRYRCYAGDPDDEAVLAALWRQQNAGA